MADEIVKRALSVLKDFRYSFEKEEYRIIVEQLVSQKVYEKRRDKFIMRKMLLMENSNWNVQVRYPARILFREDKEMPYKNFVLDEKITQKAKSFFSDRKSKS